MTLFQAVYRDTTRRAADFYGWKYHEIDGSMSLMGILSGLFRYRDKPKNSTAGSRYGIDYASGEAAVIELVEKYVALKEGVRNTKVGYF